ncbi:MAG: hypothetical protein Q9190_002484 [Brigantiaea leucoxantha]
MSQDGACSIDVTQYRPKPGQKHYALDITLFDTARMQVGTGSSSEKSNVAAGWVMVTGLDKAVVVRVAGTEDSDPLVFEYGKVRWDSNDSHCGTKFPEQKSLQDEYGFVKEGWRALECSFVCRNGAWEARLMGAKVWVDEQIRGFPGWRGVERL